MESRKDDHLLIFDEEKHKYTLDGNRVPGATTFGKGGYPTSEQLISWMIGQGGEYTYTKLMEEATHEGNFVEWPDNDKKKEILKAAKTAYRTKAEEAAGIGTIVHDYAYLVESGRAREALQMLSEHESNPNWDKINNGVKKYDGWREQNKGETVLLEAIVASVVHQFGGKFDHLSLRNGLLILSDYKTSNGIYVDQFIQLASYAIAIEEWLDKWLAQYKLPLKVGGLEILRFGKENGDDFHPMLITSPEEIEQLKNQAIRCRQTYKFRLAWESDKRFKYNGGASGTSGDSKTSEQAVKPISRKQRNQNPAS
jgi:hypothetical protein